MRNLPKKLLAQGPFTYQDALDEGLNQHAVEKLLKQGLIERVLRGIYVPADYDNTDPEAQYALATLQCGFPSCICLLSALDYHHVTDQIPNKVWIMVPQKKRVQSKHLKLIRARNPQWNIGIDKTNKGYWVTTLSRTLVECLLAKHRLGSDVAISALKTALQDKKIKLQDVYNIAIQMGVKERIFPYIETLAS